MFNWLSPYLVWIKLVSVATLLLGAVYGTWYVTSDHYEKIIAETNDVRDKAVIVAVDLQLTAIQLAGVQHAKDQALINSLNSTIDIMRIHFPPSSSAGTSSSSTNGSSGILSTNLDDAFAKLQQGTTALIQRCDQLNIDTIQLNNSIVK